MSNLWISAKSAHVSGPQPQSLSEAQKLTSAFAVGSVNYTFNANTQSVTEAQALTSAFAVTGVTYA